MFVAGSCSAIERQEEEATNCNSDLPSTTTRSSVARVTIAIYDEDRFIIQGVYVIAEPMRQETYISKAENPGDE